MVWSRWIAASVLAGAVLFAVGSAFHYLMPLVAPELGPEYSNAVVFRPWGGWTQAYMLVHPWLFGLVFAAGYLVLQGIAEPTRFGGPRDGLCYGLAVFAIGSLPVFALNFASFQVSTTLITSWVVQNLCQYTLAGLALGWYGSRAPGALDQKGMK